MNDTSNHTSNLIYQSLFIRLFILPPVCILGVIANFLNIIVFSNKKMKDISFKYMLFISINDFIYLGFCAYTSVVICNNCPLSTEYSTQLYHIIIEQYFTSCQAMFSIFADIFLSIHRSLILLNKPLYSKEFTQCRS